MVPFLLTEVVARLRKRRHPFAIHQARIPADMVEVQVSAQHPGDRGRRKPGGREVLEKRRLQVAEHVVFTLPVGTDTGVDHDVAAARAQHERLEREQHPAVGSRKSRRQPWVALQQLGLGPRQQHGDIVLESIDLDDARHFDIANLPVSDVLGRHCPSSY